MHVAARQHWVAQCERQGGPSPGEFRLLYLLCMLRYPVPLHSSHHHSQGACLVPAGSIMTCDGATAPATVTRGSATVAVMVG
jgi:hypothetical protein